MIAEDETDEDPDNDSDRHRDSLLLFTSSAPGIGNISVFINYFSSKEGCVMGTTTKAG